MGLRFAFAWGGGRSTPPGEIGLREKYVDNPDSAAAVICSSFSHWVISIYLPFNDGWSKILPMFLKLSST